MKVDDALINKLSHLARLEFNDAEKKEIAKDLQQILNLVDKLEELDLEGVEPLVYISDNTNILREDLPKKDIDKSMVLKQAPKANSDFFRVPKVIEK